MNKKWGVCFGPSYNPTHEYLTDIDPYLCDMDTVHIISGMEYVNDDDGYSHLLAPFELPVALNPDPLPNNTQDCRARLFDDRKSATQYINKVINIWRRTPEHIEFFQFDKGM
jgi:hypothetical protein